MGIVVRSASTCGDLESDGAAGGEHDISNKSPRSPVGESYLWRSDVDRGIEGNTYAYISMTGVSNVGMENSRGNV